MELVCYWFGTEWGQVGNKMQSVCDELQKSHKSVAVDIHRNLLSSQNLKDLKEKFRNSSTKTENDDIAAK